MKLFKQPPENYDDFMQTYQAAAELLHNEHEQALGSLVVAHEVAIIESEPKDLPEVLADRQSRVFDTLSSQATSVRGITDRAAYTFGRMSTTVDKDVFDRARSAFVLGESDEAYSIIDGSASDNSARRAMRTAMDVHTASKVHGLGKSLYNQHELKSGLLVSAQIREVVEDFASSSTTAPLIRAVAGREVAATTMKFNRRSNYSAATEFATESAHTPEVLDILLTLGDVVLLDRITEQVRRSVPYEASVKTIQTEATNDSVREALLNYLSTLKRPLYSAGPYKSGPNKQLQKPVKLERSEPEIINTPILEAVDQAKIDAAIDAVEARKPSDAKKVKAQLRSENPADILEVMTKVTEMRGAANELGEDVTDGQIYESFRKDVSVIESNPDEAANNLEHRQLSILTKLMGNSAEGSLPF